MTAMTDTATRLTPQPWAASKEANPDTTDDRACGWETWAIWVTIAVRVPVRPWMPPCQKPRPGHAWRTANPTRSTPVPQHEPPDPAAGPGAFGQHDEGAGHHVEHDGARGPEEEGESRREDAAEGVAERPHHEAPEDADGAGAPAPQPRGATSRSRPMPTWIQTVDAAAAAGWLVHTVRAELTMCRTHEGDVAAAGWITWDGRPTGMPDWSCRSPSNSHRSPKAVRRSRRPAGSGVGAVGTRRDGSPRATARRYCMARSWFQATNTRPPRAAGRPPGWPAHGGTRRRSTSRPARGAPIPVIGVQPVAASGPRYRP